MSFGSENQLTSWKEALLASGVPVQESYPASKLTTMAVGGPSFLLTAENVEMLKIILVCSQKHDVQFRIIGAGSNLIISDAGSRLPIVRLGAEFRFLNKRDSSVFELGAAYSLMTASRELSADGYSGFEFAGGIPAQIGGAVTMNAGAHHSDIAQICESVSVLLPDGNEVTLNASELCFSYRHSQLPKDAIVVSARFKLSNSSADKTSALRQEFLNRRKQTQPLQFPSSGSVFRNPRSDLSAGALLERVGMKGVVEGGAEVSQLHANWIINPKRQAKTSEVLKLIDIAQSRAKKEGVDLLTEVRFWD